MGRWKKLFEQEDGFTYFYTAFTEKNGERVGDFLKSQKNKNGDWVVKINDSQYGILKNKTQALDFASDLRRLYRRTNNVERMTIYNKWNNNFVNDRIIFYEFIGIKKNGFIIPDEKRKFGNGI